MSPPELLCAVLIVGSPVDDTDASPLGQDCPLHLTPLLGKNPLLYAVETLVACGIQRIVCLGWDEPAASQALLGDGQRWGCQIEWHTLSGPHQAFEWLAHIAPQEGAFLLANTVGLMLPDTLGVALAAGTLFVPEAGSLDEAKSPQIWSWAWLDRQGAQALARGAAWHDWSDAVAGVCGRRQAAKSLSLLDGAALLRAVSDMLTRKFPVVVDGSEIEPGIFVSRNVVIHPTARLTAPVFVGADVQIGRQCRIGPGVALGTRSYIGADSRIEQAQLGPDSWLGAALDVEHSVVWRGAIWSGRHQVRLPIVDAGLLSHGAAWHWRQTVTRQLGRVAAAFAWLVLLPLALLIAALHRLGLPGHSRQTLVEPVRTPLTPRTRTYTFWLGATSCTRGWRHALGFVLPNLTGVVTGRWCLVGLRPRTLEQWQQVPPTHQNWMASRSCGLLQEEWLVDAGGDNVLQSMVLERYQDMRSNELLYPLALLLRYVLQILRISRPTSRHKELGNPTWS